MTDLELFARIIQCEAGGEGDTGMRAVATVIMNRVNILQGEYGRYPTLRDVIFAPGQFDCKNFHKRTIQSSEYLQYEPYRAALRNSRMGTRRRKTRRGRRRSVVLQPLFRHMFASLSQYIGSVLDEDRQALLLYADKCILFNIIKAFNLHRYQKIRRLTW